MQIVNKFNRGEIDDLLVVREEIPKIQDSASLVNNFELLRFGSMRFRNGTEYLGDVESDSYFIPFVYSINDTADLQFTTTSFTPWVNDSKLTNDTLGVVGAITDSSDSTGSAVISGNAITLKNSNNQDGVGRVTVSNTNNQYLKLEVSGSVRLKSESVNTVLTTGTHNLKFIKNTITLESTEIYESVVTISAVPVGDVSFPVTIPDPSSLRYAISSDVIFCTHSEGWFKIERRGSESWSLVDMNIENGIFGSINSGTVKLSVNKLNGDAVLTSTSDLFSTSSIGTLYKLGSIGQQVESITTADDSGTAGIRLTGVGTSRLINYSITSNGGTSVTTLQRSPDEATWEDVKTHTGSFIGSHTDDQPNSITYYRLYVSAGNNVAGEEVKMILSTDVGSIEGVCRVKSFINKTSVNVQILSPMGGTGETRDWYESVWREGSYPSVVTLFSSRLYFGGKNKVWGSLPDAFTSFDQELEGDSKAILKTVGFGASDNPNWLSSTNRMVMGTPTDEISLRSDNFGGAITQSNMNIIGGGSRGSADIDTAKLDNDIIFVHRSLKKLHSLAHNYQSDSYDIEDFMLFNQTICEVGIKRVAVVREPETRIYVVLNNGEMRVLLYDKLENIRGWSRFTTNGLIKDIISIPATGSDIIKIVVQRGSNTYFEKLSSADSNNYIDCLGQDDESYEATFKTSKIGIISKHSILTERVRIYDIGVIGLGHIRHFEYGHSFDHLRKFNGRYKGKEESLDTYYTEHDHVKLDFAGKQETNSRICIRATKPCTIMALTYTVEESENPLKKQG